MERERLARERGEVENPEPPVDEMANLKVKTLDTIDTQNDGT